MGYAPGITFRRGGGWSLTSWGGGDAYALHAPDGWELFVQGADAERLEEELHTLDAALPDAEQDVILSRLAEPYR